MAVLIGWFLGTRALILREKQFLYCLTNTKDLRLSILWTCVSVSVDSILFLQQALQARVASLICVRETTRKVLKNVFIEVWFITTRGGSWNWKRISKNIWSPKDAFKIFCPPFKVTKNLMFALPSFNRIWTGGGGQNGPRVFFAKYIRNGLTNLHKTLWILRKLYRSSLKIKNLGIGHSLLPWLPINGGVLH